MAVSARDLAAAYDRIKRDLRAGVEPARQDQDTFARWVFEASYNRALAMGLDRRPAAQIAGQVAMEIHEKLLACEVIM